MWRKKILDRICPDNVDGAHDSNPLIDMRSDILGRPTQEMIEAMTRAAKKPYTYGFREDPITTKLEKLAADILAKEDALFLPTDTMANLIAASIHCSPGQEIVAEARSHLFTLEGGNIAAFSGIMAKPINGEMGMMDLGELELAINPGTEQRPKTGLVWIENTHNIAGGTVLSCDQMAAVEKVAHRLNIPVHLDGARIFNAAVFLRIPVSELTCYADSVSINLNKGLCAPLGAILAGKKEFIKEAERIRVMLGGGWRPTGILAAAGIVALEKMVDRLAEDHKIAKKIAQGIETCPGVFVDFKTVQTNLIFVQIKHSSISIEEFVSRLKAQNILVNVVGPNRLRIAVHREIDAGKAKRVIHAFQQICKSE